jgi:N-acetylglucosamine kinase-like BadF-type ATPase
VTRDARTELAIDAGQTGIRARLRSDGSNGPTMEFSGIRTDSPLIPQIADVVAQVATRTGQRIAVVSAGVSGLTAEQADPALLRALSAGSGVREVFLAHDSITSYLGALGDERGVVVASGTGVVTLGVGVHDVARVDGWGNLMGDAGSGYWIGREALDAVMRAHDGRGATTALTAELQREFPDVEAAYIELQADAGRVRRIASYARYVTALADTDAVAARICDSAADELALSVSTALRRVGEGASGAPVICGIGGVLRSPQIGSRLTARLTAIWPRADIRPAIAHSLDGVGLLPHLTPTSALQERVSASEPVGATR